MTEYLFEKTMCYAQVIFSILLTAYMGVFQFIRCLISGADIFLLICFAGITCAGVSLYKASIKELREFKAENNKKHHAK